MTGERRASPRPERWRVWNDLGTSRTVLAFGPGDARQVAARACTELACSYTDVELANGARA